MSERSRMAAYLQLWKEAREHEAEAKQHRLRAEAARNELEHLRVELCKTVQPRCGSATQPSRRIYTDGQYTTMIVEWDDKVSRPTISVQEPEQ